MQNKQPTQEDTEFRDREWTREEQRAHLEVLGARVAALEKPAKADALERLEAWLAVAGRMVSEIQKGNTYFVEVSDYATGRYRQNRPTLAEAIHAALDKAEEPYARLTA